MPDAVQLGNILLLTVVGVALLGSSLGRRQWRLKQWQRAVKQSRLREVATSSFRLWRAQLTAQSEPLTVRIVDAGGKGNNIVIEIEGAEGLSHLNLQRRLLQFWTDETEIGDEEFDSSYLIRGQEWSTCALLDYQMRRRITNEVFKYSSLEIRDGRLRVEVGDKVLDKVLPPLLEIARQLSEPLDAEQRIARNARYDPVDGVRLCNLLLLARERPGDPGTLRVLRQACSDKNPEIRLRAAIELGAEGRATLLKLAESDKDDAISAQAVSHLRDELTFDQLKSILARCLDNGERLRTAAACAEALGRHGATPGQLSLTGNEAEAGRLSIASDDAGQLSIAPHAVDDSEHRPERERSARPARSSRKSPR